jgi:hypothetical protein
MDVVKISSNWGAQVPEYPAPLCPVCNIPKWVNKRYPDSGKPFARSASAMNAGHAPRSND